MQRCVGFQPAAGWKAPDGGSSLDVQMKRIGDELVASLNGELDHHTAERVRGQLDAALAQDRQIRLLVLDCAGLGFMDSSGIGVMLGRHNTMKKRGGALMVRNVPPQMDRVMKAAGLYQVIQKQGAGARRGR